MIEEEEEEEESTCNLNGDWNWKFEATFQEKTTKVEHWINLKCCIQTRAEETIVGLYRDSKSIKKPCKEELEINVVDRIQKQ